MEMTTFWGKTVNRLTLENVSKQHPEAYEDLRLLEAFEDYKPQLAFDVLPNLGPRGAFSDEDQADLDKRDPNQEITDADGPTLTGQTDLIAYFPEIDELYVWFNPQGQVGSWILWNY
jgi:hypothetical protein